jgi:uncharacterized DUF497 family protein
VKISGFIWLEQIVEKLRRKHNVLPQEVEEVFQRSPNFRFVEKGHRRDENVYAALGQTIAGRYLIIFFVYKSNNKALIVSARDMDDAERKRYRQR